MLDVNEALRYLGAQGADAALRSRMEAVAREAQAFAPRWVWRVSQVVRHPQGMLLADAGLLLPGNTASRMLEECHQAALLLCTLGVQFDGWVRGLQARDMAKAAMADACGSALVESGCDAAQREMADRFAGVHQTDRFSPGYGDLPLTLQKDMCRILDSRRLGVYVTESCLMNPQKSVTAIIGLSDRPQRARIRGCGYCAMRNTCALRKGGHSCEV